MAGWNAPPPCIMPSIHLSKEESKIALHNGIPFESCISENFGLPTLKQGPQVWECTPSPILNLQ